ncbi:hypothetical protein ACPC54_17945 [Kitasatospora sp. NPDC094028]
MSIVDLASVKLHLNIPSSDTRQDTELGRFISAADDQARYVCGPVTAELHTEWYDGGRPVISLDWQPVASVTSVTEFVASSTWNLTEQPLGGGGMDSYGYTVDLARGTITRRAVGQDVPFPRGLKNVRVVYTAGPGVVAPTVFLGALELVRHLWQQTQQGGRPKFGATGSFDGDGAAVPMGFALPARVLELWAPFRRAPGVA